MPIVAPADSDEELMQGDILQNVPFLIVGLDGKATFVKDAEYVLVLSRPAKRFVTMSSSSLLSSPIQLSSQK